MSGSARGTSRHGRKAVIGAALVLIGLPAALAAIEAADFYVHNTSNGVIISSGEKREYLLYVPSGYDASRPTPLVISLHGAAMWGAAQRETSRWNEVAEREGFIVVYPSGTGFPRVWRASLPGTGLRADVRFISELIDTLQAAYNIDPERIYADGLSNGGGMAFVLSCAMSDRIAAMGMVAPALFLPWSWCADRRPVPVIAFHGTADPITPYRGGTSWVAHHPLADIPRWMANWARGNRCAPDPVDSLVAADVTRLEYADCDDDASVVLYRIEGGGHSWPGGKPPPEWFVGPTSHSVDASSLMWAFYREHPLRRTQTAAP